MHSVQDRAQGSAAGMCTVCVRPVAHAHLWRHTPRAQALGAASPGHAQGACVPSHGGGGTGACRHASCKLDPHLWGMMRLISPLYTPTRRRTPRSRGAPLPGSSTSPQPGSLSSSADQGSLSSASCMAQLHSNATAARAKGSHQGDSGCVGGVWGWGGVDRAVRAARRTSTPAHQQPQQRTSPYALNAATMHSTLSPCT